MLGELAALEGHGPREGVVWEVGLAARDEVGGGVAVGVDELAVDELQCGAGGVEAGAEGASSNSVPRACSYLSILRLSPLRRRLALSVTLASFR